MAPGLRTAQTVCSTQRLTSAPPNARNSASPPIRMNISGAGKQRWTSFALKAAAMASPAGAANIWGSARRKRDTAFLTGYLLGRRIYGLETSRDIAQEAYDKAVSSVDYQHAARRRARAVLDDPAATAEELEDARKDFDYAVDALRRAERDSEDALYELGRADEALDQGIATQGQWRESSDFRQSRSALEEAHGFARAAQEINHCADEFGSHTPVCFLTPGAAVTSRDGGVCAVGPGEARMVARRGGERPVHDYLFYPGEAGSSRVARRPSWALQRAV